MKMSSKTEYAMKTLLDLATQDKNAVVHIADIASRQHIPVKFLEQILLVLKSAGLVSSKRGAKGGYFLALPPSRINLATVVSITDDHLLQRSGKNKPLNPFEEIWSEMNDYLLNRLEKATLQSVCDRIEQLQNAKPANYII